MAEIHGPESRHAVDQSPAVFGDHLAALTPGKDEQFSLSQLRMISQGMDQMSKIPRLINWREHSRPG